MSETPMREMELGELMGTLPVSHIARKQFMALTNRLSREKDKVFELEQQASLTFDENTKFQIKGGQLVVSIGFEGLKRSIELDSDLLVTDNAQAAISIKSVISSEEENGRTLFHSMLSEAAWIAFGDGEDGFEETEC